MQEAEQLVLEEDLFIERFKPILNDIMPERNTMVHLGDGEWEESYGMFETYGPELEFVKAQPPNQVWTCIEEDADGGLLSGFHFVNRLWYVVTEIPFKGDPYGIDIWVPLWNSCGSTYGCICGECTEVWDNEVMDWVNRPEDYDKWLPNRKTHQ